MTCHPWLGTRRCKVLLREGYGGHQPALVTSERRFRAKAGGAEGIRTPDLLIANQPLYQLSYDPSQFCVLLNSDYYAVLRPDDKSFASE
jgi:hypothetical protein